MYSSITGQSKVVLNRMAFTHASEVEPTMRDRAATETDKKAYFDHQSFDMAAEIAHQLEEGDINFGALDEAIMAFAKLIDCGSDLCEDPSTKPSCRNIGEMGVKGTVAGQAIYVNFLDAHETKPLTN